MEPVTRGDPMRPLLWTSRSLAHLTAALKEKGYAISIFAVRRILKSLKYSLQGNRKTHEGGKHPDRNAQFLYIHKQKEKFLAAGEPVLSVDGKKKEPIGNYKNNGCEWHPKNMPEHVNVHDFADPGVGRATPYGIYDVALNRGWVSVGKGYGTARFAVNALRQWWLHAGKNQYEKTKGISIAAVGGGSNGSRVRLWKIALQELANEWGIPITVCHYPPGTSKWNPIEHKLFFHISKNWRGKPLRAFDDIVQYICATTTKAGLTAEAKIDTNIYRKGIKISDKELRAVNMTKHAFHGEWNYTISPALAV